MRKRSRITVQRRGELGKVEHSREAVISPQKRRDRDQREHFPKPPGMRRILIDNGLARKAEKSGGIGAAGEIKHRLQIVRLHSADEALSLHQQIFLRNRSAKISGDNRRTCLAWLLWQRSVLAAMSILRGDQLLQDPRDKRTPQSPP